MGKYDQYLVGLPPSTGKYDSFTSDLPQEVNNAERIEPGVYGETDPTGQKILENLGSVAGGYGMGQLVGGGLMKAAGSKLGRALLNSPQEIGTQMREGLSKATPPVIRRPPELGPKAEFENPYQHPSDLPNVKYQVKYPLGKYGPPSEPLPVPTGGKMVRPKPTFPAEPLPTSVPLKYPDDPASFYNFANSRMKGFASDPNNIRLTPTELNDYKTILSDKLTAMQAQGMSKAPIFSDLSDLQSRVSDIHASVIPGRADLNDVYGLSKGIRAIPGKAFRGAKQATKWGAATAVLGKYLSQ